MTAPLFVREAGRGPPLLLLHAFPLSSEMWEQTADRMAARCRLLMPDLPGFGASPCGEHAPAMDVIADRLAGALRVRGVERAVVCGVSMGGFAAMALARRYPDMVESLLVCASNAGADAPEVRAFREELAQDVLRRRSIAPAIAWLLPEVLAATTHRERPEIVERVRALMEQASPEGVAWSLRAMAGRPDSHALLGRLAIPIMIVLGEEDASLSAALRGALLAAAPRADLVRIPDAGHLPPLETPDAFCAALHQLVETRSQR